MAEDVKNTRENARKERMELWEKRKAKKMELAGRDYTMVVSARARDTRALVGIAQIGDVAANRIRNGMSYEYQGDEAMKLLNEYNQSIREYARVVEKLCKFTNVDFRVPRWMKNSKEEIADEETSASDD